MKRTSGLFFLSVLVGITGCLTSENNVGSVGNDSGVVDGAGQVARDVQAQRAEANPILADAAAPDAPGVAQDSPTAGVPDASNLAKDAVQKVPDTGAIPPCQAEGGVCNKPPEQPADICTTVDMVWRSGGVEDIRDVNCASSKVSETGFCYSFPEDECDGYRCLVGNEISPACYTLEQCQYACDGTCVPIASMGEQCAKADVSAGTQCEGDGGVCKTWPEKQAEICSTAEMVWQSDAGLESRREPNCNADGSLESGSCYSFVQDACGGYRCLVGNGISPACQTLEQCQADCSGACLLIPSMRGPCSKVYGTGHECELKADGTCSPVMFNTACTPFTGRRYDKSAGCYSAVDTTLGCCATAVGLPCPLPTATGCYQVAVAGGGTVEYWTPVVAISPVEIPDGTECDQSEAAKVVSAPPCVSTSTDAAVPIDAVPPDAATVSPDAHVPASLPLCTTDSDCCVTVDSCTATATLGGKAGWGPVPGTHASPGTCIPCIPPAIQVQCQNGFCVGKRIPNVSSGALTTSHCGYIVLPDAGAAPSVAPHAVVDGGAVVESYQTSWGC
jgi:hypothetical protein